MKTVSAVLLMAFSLTSIFANAQLQLQDEMVIQVSEQTEKLCAKIDGNICLMTQPNAVKFCEDQGLRLPGVRDFVSYSVSRGAKGKLEYNEVKGAAPKGYYAVNSQLNDGLVDKFYFNHEGFVRPEGIVGSLMFWTDSIAYQHPEFAHVFYGEFGGGGGKPEEHKLDYPNAVICLPLN